MHRLSSILAVATALLSSLACSSSDFQLATDPASADGGGGGPGGGPAPECLEPKPVACVVPESGHPPIWSTAVGTTLDPRLSIDTMFAFEMNVPARGRVDKFEVPMATEGTGCTGVVTVYVLVETCPGHYVQLRQMDRPASEMKASSNYWWFNADGQDLPWMKEGTRYRFQVATDSPDCRFRIAGLPAGQTRGPAARFTWFFHDGERWTAQPGEAVAVPWFARCPG